MDEKSGRALRSERCVDEVGASLKGSEGVKSTSLSSQYLRFCMRRGRHRNEIVLIRIEKT
jgi:hypothetical protein